MYLGEGDGDASVQLNVVGQLCELVLLLLKRLQQTVDLLFGQHHSAVVLRNNGGTSQWRESVLSLLTLAPRWNSPAGVSSRSAGRPWTPETAGWSCPPAAAAAR